MSNLENMHTPEQPKENPYRAQILQEAAQLITGDRQKDYGPPEENFQRIADYWNVYLQKKLRLDEKLTPREIAEMMILLKVARLSSSPTRDTYVDIGGYSGIAAESADTEKKLAEATEVKRTDFVVDGQVIGDKFTFKSEADAKTVADALKREAQDPERTDYL